MSWLQFVAALADSLAWPLVVVAVVVILRHALSRALLGLSRLVYKGMGQEVELGWDVRELRQAAEQATLPEPSVQPERLPAGTAPDQVLVDAERELARVDREMWELVRAAEFAPNAAVIEAWNRVEHELRALAMRRKDKIRDRFVMDLIKNMAAEGVLDAASVRVLLRLRDVRNRAAHPTAGGDVLSYAEAVTFVDIARRLLHQLGSVTIQPEPASASASASDPAVSVGAVVVSPKPANATADVGQPGVSITSPDDHKPE